MATCRSSSITPTLPASRRVNAAALAEIATAPPTPPRAGLVGDLSPRTTLRWRVPDGAAGCEVVWRKTVSMEWEGVKFFPASVTAATLPLSKDGYLFGVRAVGSGGARSLPAIPVAER